MIEPAVFPFRVAAIDMGSNAIRFVVAEFVAPSQWVELEAHRVPVRLGHEVFLTGQLAESQMTATVEAMASFRRAIDTLGVPRYRAVATSAVRESRNGGELAERIRRECGIRLETITGTEEARLVWLAIRARMDLGESRWLAVDLGGGSLEVSDVSADGIHWSESHTMGTVRILEDLGSAGSGSGTDVERTTALIEEYVGTLRLPDDVARERRAGLIATGGNIEALARLAGVRPDGQGVSRLKLSKLSETVEALGHLSVAERMERHGLRQDRADVIHPAGLLYERVARLAGVDAIHVPHVGVKEGVLLDVADDLTGPGVHASRREQQAFLGAVALGRRFEFDEAHARHVTRLALSLFDQLQPVHGLSEADRRLLLVAAVLHDIGQFIAYRRHHKHSLYLIYNSDVPNVTSGELALVALVARYHRRAEPKPEHFVFRDLSPEDQERVRRLGALLRLADALDREHLQRVFAVQARYTDDELVLEVEGQGDLLLEQWALQKKSRMFTSVFGRSVRFVSVDQPAGARVL
jgi:exopolyphosphatase/guanosine-5'-triphosphate,3'-diphosphate pyrophosphatase